MATYSFDTITAAQAASFQPTDSLSFGSTPVTSATVIYGAATVTISVAGRALDFGPGLSVASMAGAFTDANGGRLFVGDVSANSVDMGSSDTRNDALFGGAGDDNLNARGGNNLLQGNQGADTLTAVGGVNTIYGGQDNDLITVSGFGQGNKGDDQITGSAGADTLLGGQGDDTITGNDGRDFLNGNLGNDLIDGGGTVLGEGGNDVIHAHGNNVTSLVDGGDGDDWITSAFTSVFGNGVTVEVLGGDGNDHIDASFFGNTIDGGAGNDTISANMTSVARQVITGGLGDDYVAINRAVAALVDGGDGNDTLLGYAELNLFQGGNGDDWIAITSTNGTSILRGNEGNDTILATMTATDTLDGGAGDDTLLGGWMTGGAGHDTFQLGTGFGPDLLSKSGVLDWSGVEDYIHPANMAAGFHYSEATASDLTTALVQFQALSDPAAVMAFQIGSDVVIFSVGPFSVGTAAIVLVGRSLTDVSELNFV